VSESLEKTIIHLFDMIISAVGERCDFGCLRRVWIGFDADGGHAAVFDFFPAHTCSL